MEKLESVNTTFSDIWKYALGWETSDMCPIIYVIMMVTDALGLNWRQAICNHHAVISWSITLTHCGLVMPYGNIDLGQQWLK